MKLFLACAVAVGMAGCHEARSARKTVAHPTPDWSIDKCRITYKGRLVPLGDTITKWVEMFGLGRPTGIDLPGEASGVIAGPDWKKARLKEGWYKGDTVNYSIGQGFLLTTPLQLASMYAVIANGGKVVRPRLAMVAPKMSVDLNIEQSHINMIRKGLDFVVRRGTAQRAGGFGITVAGKTGTAQNAHGADHALFVGYAPMEDPKYVAVAVLEAGLHGGSVASPIVGELLSYLLVPASRVKQP